MDKAEVVFEKLASNARTKYLLYLEKKLPQVFRSFINKSDKDFLLVTKHKFGTDAAKHLSAANKDLNRLTKSTKETGKTIAKAAKVGAQGASEFAKGVKSGATATVDAAKKAKPSSILST